MPELPEVETVVRTLRPHVAGRRISSVRFLSPLAAEGRPEVIAARLRGRRIRGLRRIGKYLVFDLDRGVLTVHLRMTGKLLLTSAITRFARAILTLDQGQIVFDDVRQFGRIAWHESVPAQIRKLGPDPLNLTAEEFAALLRARRGGIKPLLLNQTFLSGVGNIYADEVLFRARIHPLTEACRIGQTRAARLHTAIVEVLGEAIAAGGTSISDYVNATGTRGSFHAQLRVYGRAGKPCVVCGVPLKRVVTAQRSTHYCPACQRR